MRNLYEVLGLAVGAEPDHVKEIFRELAKTWHPDLNTGDATAEKRFKEVIESYVLSDPERRSAYDLGLKHKLGAAHRRLRHAMVATTACFVVTVCYGRLRTRRACPSGWWFI